MAYKYKGYNPKNAKHVIKYNKSHYKNVGIAFPIDEYPLIKERAESENLTVSGWIKKLVAEALKK